MKRNIENPTITNANGVSGKEQIVTHPAFASIQASRISGQANLYGSEFSHQHFIGITISKSETKRSLSHDWMHDDNELIKVYLSEAQWATFVSSLNSKSTACTLDHIQGNRVPQLPAPIAKDDAFRSEIMDVINRSVERLNTLEKMINESKLSAKDKQVMVGQAAMAKQEITSNLNYVTKSFGSHIETTKEKAKTEINAYITSAVQRAGLNELTSKSIKLISDES